MPDWNAMRRLCWVALGCLLLVASACSDDSGGEAAPPATVPKATTTTAIDVSQVPDEITIEYANAVMDELDKVLGDAIRVLVREKAPTKEFDQRLDALYDEPELEHKRSVWGQEAAHEMEGYRPNPGDPETTVESIVRQAGDCVLLAVDRDFAPALLNPADVSTKGWIALKKRTDVDGLNPTAWSIVFDAGTKSGNPPAVCQ